MNSVAGISCFSLLLLLAVGSQSYPQFEFRREVLRNNSFVVRGAPTNIGEGQDDSLHCVTDNSECCSNGQGNWYDEKGDEVHQGSDGNSDLYVTRGQGVVYLNRRTRGSTGLWRCDIPDSSGVQQSIYIYLGTPETGIHLHSLVSCCPILVLFCTKQEHYSTLLTSTSLWTQRSVRILLSSPSHV